MVTIKAMVSDFKGGFEAYNGSKSQEVSWLHFLKYGMTAGMPLYSHWGTPSLEALYLSYYKACGIICALNFDGRYLKVSSYYKNMEQTEKASISTWVGVAGTALMADRILDIPRLCYAETALKEGRVSLNPTSKQCADFVGEDIHNRWHVLEAKARQKNPSKSTRKQWKEQAQTIWEVDKQVPSTHSYCFTKVSNPCDIKLVDPPRDYSENEPTKIKRDKLTQQYYQVLLDVLKYAEVNYIADEPIRFKMIGLNPINGEYTYIGLHDKVFEMVNNGKTPPLIKPMVANPFSDEEDLREEQYLRDSQIISKTRFFLASDGVTVTTSKYPDKIENYGFRHQ